MKDRVIKDNENYYMYLRRYLHIMWFLLKQVQIREKSIQHFWKKRSLTRILKTFRQKGKGAAEGKVKILFPWDFTLPLHS